jgi:hypothetical protein
MLYHPDMLDHPDSLSFQMRLTYKQLATMLDHPDSPYIPAVGLLYVRYVVDPKVLNPKP